MPPVEGDRRAADSREVVRVAARAASSGLRMTVDEVSRRLAEDPEHTAIVDARAPDAWGSSDVKAGGAIRIPPDEAEKHLADLRRDDLIVAYCT
jgi:rhodanese-related sulfurtransferase